MRILTTILFVFFSIAAGAQSKDSLLKKPDPAKKLMTVETACGQCKFGLVAEDCSLAVRINGKAYFADGTDIDAHGNAHAKDGFCNAVRKAQVQGELVNDRFKLSYFKLLKP
jgi:hypothetical protein